MNLSADHESEESRKSTRRSAAQSNKRDLFLSHASEDKESLVRPVADELRLQNLSIWLDEGDLHPGMNLIEAINSGISNARVAVVFLTKNFFRKRFPLLELSVFIKMGKPIIPVSPDLLPHSVEIKFPLLSATYGIFYAANPHEIARRIVRAYDFLRPGSGKNRKTLQLGNSLENCRGRIRLPADGSSVGPLIAAEGDLVSLPESAWLWLVVEIGNLKWPKEPGINISGNRWFGDALEGGTPPDGRFTLALYVTGKVGHEQIKKWITHGHRSGIYPGLLNIKDAKRLDSVNLYLRQK